MQPNEESELREQLTTMLLASYAHGLSLGEFFKRRLEEGQTGLDLHKFTEALETLLLEHDVAEKVRIMFQRCKETDRH